MANLLSQRAMLARLKIAVWSARKLDRKVTDKVNQEHNAAADAGRYNKRLVSKDALASIQTIASKARTEHYARTLPWQDDGQRILTAHGHLEYAATMAKLKDEFAAAVETFCAGYPEFIINARLELNGLFQESDYPPPDSIRSRFGFSTAIDNVPDAADFRVDLDPAQAAEIRADIEARTRQAIADAQRDIWQRIVEHVGHMAERLRAYKPATNGDKAQGVFRDSLVDNVRALVALLPSLNLANDPALAAMAERLESLCRDDAAELRDNANARASVAAEADAILKDVGAFLA